MIPKVLLPPIYRGTHLVLLQILVRFDSHVSQLCYLESYARGRSILKSNRLSMLKKKLVQIPKQWLMRGHAASLSSSPPAPQADSCSYLTDTYGKLTVRISAKGNKSQCGIPLWRIWKMVDFRYYFRHLETQIITLHEALHDMLEAYLKRNLLCSPSLWLNPSNILVEKTD